MTEEDVKELLRNLKSFMSKEFAMLHTTMDGFESRLNSMDSGITNELRAIGNRITRLENRVTNLEER